MKLKYVFEMMEIDDRVVAVPIGDNAGTFSGIIKVNETAASILSILKSDTTEENVLEQLAKEYDMSSEDAKNWVHSFLCQLKEIGVLE